MTRAIPFANYDLEKRVERRIKTMESDDSVFRAALKLKRERLQGVVEHVLNRLSISATPRFGVAYLRASWWTKGPLAGFEPTDGTQWVPSVIDWPAEVARRVAEARSDENIFIRAINGNESSAFRATIETQLSEHDPKAPIQLFSGDAVQIDTHLFVGIVEFDRNQIATTSRAILLGDSDGLSTTIGLLDACVHQALSWFGEQVVLDEATRIGRLIPPRTSERDIDTILRRAGSSMMASIRDVASGERFHFGSGDLFTQLDALSVLRHERVENTGTITFLPPDLRTSDDRMLAFETPVPLNETGWARKILEMSRSPFTLVSRGTSLQGLLDTRLISKPANDMAGSGVFVVTFKGQHQWVVRAGQTEIMHVVSGIPRLPRRPLTMDRFAKSFRRLFTDADADADAVWSSIEGILFQDHGAVVVVASDADQEAQRLGRQATCINPRRLSTEEVKASARIDGAILLAPDGKCHAIGAILDGNALPSGSPARGARFNSALRYVCESQQRLAVVRSDDGWIDLLPRLRPQVKKADLEVALADLRAAGRPGKGEPRLKREGDLISTYADLVSLSEGDELLIMAHAAALNALDESFKREEYDPHPTDLLSD